MNKVWDTIWESYQKIPSVQILNEPAGMTQRSEFVGLLLKYFDLKGKSILDVGTGTGQYCIELSLRGAHCLGIDIDPGSIKLAKRLANDYDAYNCSFKNMDLFDLKDDKFDIVFSMGTVEHFSNEYIIKMLRKMSEIGDYVIIGVPFSGSQTYMLSKAYSKKIGTWEYGEEQNFQTLSKLFKEAGLFLLQEKTIGLCSEAYYFKRINNNLIPLQIADNLKKMFEGKDIGSWLISIGSKRRSLEPNIPEGEVSIIIPVYNGEKYIKRLVRNLDHCRQSNFEIIFVNDDSTDDTKKELGKYYEYYGATIINLKKNVGEIGARLEGLKRASNDYVYFLDVDDLIFPGGITTMLQDLKSCPDNTYLSNSCAMMEKGKFTGPIWFHEFWKNPRDYIVSELINLCGKISLGNTIIRKEGLLAAYEILDIMLKKANRERMKVSGDSILLDIMVFNGYIEKIIPVYYTYRGYEHGESTSASQQIDDRIRDIPLQMAYCFNKINGTNELENLMTHRAIISYGSHLGSLFMNNFKTYREVLNV